MRIPLTKYGLPQIVVFPAIQFTVMAVVLAAWPKSLPIWGIILVEIIFTLVLIGILSFFRDPQRIVPTDKNILLAPADGTITDINIIQENDFIAGSALRISIFLSIFDVHINRVPCNVKVENITSHPVKFKNAANPSSGRVNESNDLWLRRTDSPNDKLILRQISGAIARRIICDTDTGQKLAGGQKFGMIKFGSRTELYLPTHKNAKPLVKKGDKVKAGLTPIIKYEI